MRAGLLRTAFPQGFAYKNLQVGRLRAAAVLVALEPGKGVWLTRRSMRMPSHPGQVSFPGGKVEPFDASVEAAALREAQEEVGLNPAQAEVLGRMDDYVTGTGFHIAPVVALVPEKVALLPATEEVEELFLLPFSVLLNPDYPTPRKAYGQTGLRDFWVWPHPDHVIWGATAEMLRRVAMRLRGVE
ncbi:MAG: CoA pyrophosphatase [Rhodospirillales bacterium]|nr:CoA pyrophosphatase [Rhodospirillales bacterium]